MNFPYKLSVLMLFLIGISFGIAYCSKKKESKEMLLKQNLRLTLLHYFNIHRRN